MAVSKVYIVERDGKELKKLKTLSSAKKLADAENAEVLCEGTVVYSSGTEIKKNERINKYTLNALMNIRKAPSLEADKVGVAQAGKVVEVLEIKNDWLCLTDGTFILYGNGKYAKKS